MVGELKPHPSHPPLMTKRLIKVEMNKFVHSIVLDFAKKTFR
jgi:hypothetical protein